ncbi:hypothetical protein [Kaistella palustris]|uniref:hypothetical protein n=1 Tax=Kaistella palustris TaxID=493376 RepID=UPI00041FF9A4|nr:hypothetical protein [Kaistella palustris]
MKKFIFTTVSTVIFHFVSAQAITAANVNSNNVLDYFEQNKMQLEAKSSDILVQMGNGNIIETADRSAKILSLAQIGNYNTTYFINPNNHTTNAEVNIKGSGNYIDITGSNSISNGIKININANDMTIFMRNY